MEPRAHSCPSTQKCLLMRRNPIRSRHPTPLRLACFDEYFSFDVVPLFFLSLLGPQGDANWPEASSYSLFCFYYQVSPSLFPQFFFPPIGRGIGQSQLCSEPNTKKKPQQNKTKKKHFHKECFKTHHYTAYFRPINKQSNVSISFYDQSEGPERTAPREFQMIYRSAAISYTMKHFINR